MTATIQEISVDAIRVGKRMRHVVDSRVEKLAESIRTLGVRVPVSVMESDGGFLLVAGLHRLEASRRLGLQRVPCMVMENDEIEARLWEVDENLMRSELSAPSGATSFSYSTLGTSTNRSMRSSSGPLIRFL